ncbi:hypothetical protein ACN28I_20365 [Archangium gephyra]|uniref:hypothetical protein n=1 Tax=Archangium gephyra TaxID=48 RepID=UPI003B79C155
MLDGDEEGEQDLHEGAGHDEQQAPAEPQAVHRADEDEEQGERRHVGQLEDPGQLEQAHEPASGGLARDVRQRMADGEDLARHGGQQPIEEQEGGHVQQEELTDVVRLLQPEHQSLQIGLGRRPQQEGAQVSLELALQQCSLFFTHVPPRTRWRARV